jgi:hypothetical protein
MTGCGVMLRVKEEDTVLIGLNHEVRPSSVTCRLSASVFNRVCPSSRWPQYAYGPLAGWFDSSTSGPTHPEIAESERNRMAEGTAIQGGRGAAW